ncbi:MAG TPA: AMP-binding protein [Herpetosiphonaceae bacterium]
MQSCIPSADRATLVHELLDETAARLPDKTALITDEGSITYSALADSTRRLAGWLIAAGVERGDRVALMLPNGIPIVTALLAASRVGAIFFIVNPGIKTYHLRHILEDAEPTLIITTEKRRAEEQLESYARVLTLEDGWQSALERDAWSGAFSGISSDPVCLIYTSGSTGKPKAVISSQRNVVFAARAIQQCLAMQESDVVGNFLPLSFDVGLYQIFLSFQIGATLALGSDLHVGPGLLRKINQWNVTGLPAVPSLVLNLLRLANRSREQLPRLRYITNTGAHLPRSYIDEVRALMPDCTVFVMFGLTECKRVSILPPADYKRKSESVGKPLPDTECLIVDADGQPLPAGEIGELVVRGPHVMLGYWRAPELTAKRYRPWGAGTEIALFTGDACSLDDEGYLYFHGRSDDIYKQGGYRVSALEVEAAACDIPGVRQAALLPPQTERGSVLFVTSDLAIETVFAALRERLEDYKLPTQIVVLDDLPLTPNGKSDKKQLRSLMLEASQL